MPSSTNYFYPPIQTCATYDTDDMGYPYWTCQSSTPAPTTAPTKIPTKPQTTTPTAPLKFPTLTPTTPTASPVSGSSSSSCFAGEMSVSLESGAIKTLKDVVLGDSILSYSPSEKIFLFSDVMYLPHSANNQLSSFIELSFESVRATERVLLLTPDHLILAGDCKDSVNLVLRAAQSIKVGECLMNERGEKVRVLTVSEEYLVVEGVVASPFAVNHFLVHKFSFPSFACSVIFVLDCE